MTRSRSRSAHDARKSPTRAPVQLRIPGSSRSGWSVKLRVRLSRRPLPTAASIDELVIGATLVLPIALETASEPDASLTRDMYFRSVQFALTNRDVILASAETKGQAPTALLSASLDHTTTMLAIRALAGKPTSLEIHAVGTDLQTPMPPLSAALTDLMRTLKANVGHEDNLDSFVVLTAPDPLSGEYRSIPNRTKDERRDVRSTRPVLAPMGRGFGSISAAAAVSHISSAPASAVAVHPSLVASSRLHHEGLASDMVLSPNNNRPHLPQIDDRSLDLWPDTLDPSLYWYLPAFRVVQPDPAKPASESLFVYRFKESGHDSEGRPGLNATITFALRQEPCDAVTRRPAELKNLEARPVPFENLAVSLSIPFRDEHGQTRREIVTATTERTGDVIVATVSLLDNWARLAYGALAVDGFQSEPPRITADIYFTAMVRQSAVFDWLGVTTKYDRLQLSPRRELNGNVTLATTMGAVQFARESAGSSRTARPLSVAQNLAVHGQLHSQILTAQGVSTPIYTQQTILRSRELICLFPCETLGAFYLQTTDDGEVAVGCRDALKLGQTDYRLYAPVEDLRISKRVRVFRSLLQPGRFVIAPMGYKITRFGADSGDRAFRPAIFLYSSLDASAPENNHAALMATLGPDVQAHEIEQLRDLLREISPNPTLQMLTEIAADVSYTWSVTNGEVVKDQHVIRRWDSFQVSVAADLDEVPLLEAMLNTGGMAIAATYTLPDSSVIATTLELNLNSIVGPIGRTPIDVTVIPGGANLVNRIECDVDIDDLMVIDDAADPGHSAITTVPVERSPAPGESVTVHAEIPPAARLVPIATPKSSAATLAEIRSFVEDIYTQIAFINLLNFDNHNLASIAVEAHVMGLPETYNTMMASTDNVQILEMVLPLTRYLSHPVIQFQASITRRDNRVQQTSWIDWSLENKGNVVGITWELLGMPN